MQKVNFLTPISFGGHAKTFFETVVEKADRYISWDSQTAHIIPGTTIAVLQNNKTSNLNTALKAASLLAFIVPLYLRRRTAALITFALPLIACAIKVAGRMAFQFQALNVQQKVEEGIEISEQIVADIEQLMPKILHREPNDQLKWYGGNYEVNRIFGLASHPDLVFKMVLPSIRNSNDQLQQRFANMIKAREVCLIHRLDLLVVPHAKLFTAHKTNIIAEERLSFPRNASVQEEIYTFPGMDRTTEQLATFVAKTGFWDVEWRNMPVMDGDPSFMGDRRVALIDLEHMGDPSRGFFAVGLILRLSSEKQIDRALAIAKENGIVHPRISPEQSKAQRMAQLQSDKNLRLYHEEHGILANPRKLLQIDDINSLGLDLNEKGKIRVEVPGEKWGSKQIVLREAVKDVIQQINAAITQSRNEDTIKSQRTVVLDHDDRDQNFALYNYHMAGASSTFGVDCYDEVENKRRWLRRILDSLVEKGHLFQIITIDAYGYKVQA